MSKANRSPPLSAAVLAALLASATVGARAQPAAPAAVAIGATDIGGVVTGPRGPEAGVWVIAETTDLPTKYAKIVVTDERGRYVIPDLPRASYKVWVRGYGLVDSPRVDGAPGRQLNLRATSAPTPAAAAEAYPGMYWYSMLRIPAADQFPGTGVALAATAFPPSCAGNTPGSTPSSSPANPATRWAAPTSGTPARNSAISTTPPTCGGGASSPARP
jgi:hypothetical protein